MPDVLSGYTWDRSARRYRSQATGRYVARNTVVNLLESHVNGGDQRIEALTTAFYEGRIAPSVFAEQMRTQLKRLHLQNAALGAGGWDRLTPADYGRVGQRLRTDYARITRLANDVQSENVTLPQALNRAAGYVGNSRVAFWETDRAAQVAEPGMVIIERRVISARESCRDCLNYYAMGWQPIGVLPVPGVASACQTHCRCRMERRQVPATEIGAFVKRSPVQVIVEEDAKRAEAKAKKAEKPKREKPPKPPKPPKEPKPLGLRYKPSQDQVDRVLQNVDRRIRSVAEQTGYDVADVEQSVNTLMTKLTTNNQVAVNFHSRNMDALLTDGRFKSQFETGTSGAILNKNARLNSEELGLGIPYRARAQNRPIYGYLRTSKQAEEIGYGDITFVFKDGIKDRSTITAGDSLYDFAGGVTVGTPMRAPTKASWGEHVSTLFDYDSGMLSEKELLSRVRYFEVQMQNGVSLDDVSHIIDRGGKLTTAQLDALRKRGIQVWNSD